MMNATVVLTFFGVLGLGFLLILGYLLVRNARSKRRSESETKTTVTRSPSCDDQCEHIPSGYMPPLPVIKDHYRGKTYPRLYKTAPPLTPSPVAQQPRSVSDNILPFAAGMVVGGLLSSSNANASNDDDYIPPVVGGGGESGGGGASGSWDSDSSSSDSSSSSYDSGSGDSSSSDSSSSSSSD